MEIERREVPSHEREVCVLDDDINDGQPWYYDIRNFVDDRIYPKGADRKDRRAPRLLATQYILCDGVLYRRSYEGVHLRCVDKEEVEKLIKEVHQGVWSSQTTTCILKTKSKEFCRNMVSSITSHLPINHRPMEL
jgi:hypothetical protein